MPENITKTPPDPLTREEHLRATRQSPTDASSRPNRATSVSPAGGSRGSEQGQAGRRSTEKRKQPKTPHESLNDLPFQDLVAVANTGDAAAIRRLRRVLDTNPEIWREAGDLAGKAEELMVNLLAGKSELARSRSSESSKTCGRNWAVRRQVLLSDWR